MTDAKKILYIDMDNVLVDFKAGLAKVYPPVSEDADNIPGIFALMPPMDGALEAFHELAGLFDTYILSTAPWDNPQAWQHKVEWVRDYLGAVDGTPAYKRLILSHHKNLNLGDFLVDDRPCHRGADKFVGEVIPFGYPAYPDWPSVVEYLRTRAV